MRIVILTQYFPPEMGAPQNRLYELARGLKKFEWEVSVVTALPNYPTGKIFPGYRGKVSFNEEIDGITVQRYWLFASNSTRSLPRILSMLSFSITCLLSVFFIRSKKPDYILVESPPLTLGFSAYILSLFTGARLIFNVSDLWPLSAKELGAIGEGLLYDLIVKLEHFMYQKAFICTGQSEEIINHIKPLTKSPAYLFRNGVDTTRFLVESNDAGAIPRIVYAGLLGVAQGIVSICERVDFAKLGLEFHIYGTGAEKETLLSFLSSNPGRGIFYHGVMAREDIPSILKEFDATLVSLVKNIYGAVPSKIYEALAAGLPVFFSGDGEGSKIIIENRVGWVNKPHNMQQLANNFRQYFSLSECERQALKIHCNQVAKQKFDRTRQIADFARFLRDEINV